MFDAMLMAENIKEYRKKKGLNQSEFASKLGLSPQSVSKWETGISCPSIENLCIISEILDVSIDKLVCGEKEQEKTMIGIDGGGTKTEFVLFTESGRILNRLLLGGCNANTVGLENAVDTLKLGIDTLLKMEGKICGIFVGAAGLDSGNNTKLVQDALEKAYPDIKIRCENDIFNVIACGTNPDVCTAAICGTGIVVYANKNGSLKCFGGRGYLLDEAGSGYHIGRDAICAALDARDGIGNMSILTALVEEKLGATVWESIHDIYSKDQSYIASFAPCVFKAYQNGDDIAEQILRKNAEYLVGLINYAAKSCDVGTHVVASGSIVTQKSAFYDMLKEMLDSDLELEVPEYPPVYGACIMCCRLCGADTTPITENFKDFYDTYQ